MLSILRRRLSVKLTIGYGAAVVSVTVAVGIFLTRQLEEGTLWQLETSLATQAHLIAEALPERRIQLEARPKLQSLVRNLAADAHGRVTLIAVDGTVVADSDVPLEALASMENHRGRPEVQTALLGRVGRSTRRSATLRRGLFYVAVPVTEQGAVSGIVRVALPLTQVHEMIASVAKTLAAGLGMTVLLIVLVSGWLARRMTRPLTAMAISAQRLARGELSSRAPVMTRDEVGQLGHAFNAMAEDLQAKIHELEAHRSQIEGILQSMVEGVLAVGPTGDVLLANAAAGDMVGVKHQIALETGAKDLIRQPELKELIHQTLTTQQPHSRDLTLYAPSERTLRIHATTYQAPVGRGALLVLYDITDLKRLENLRRDFVANVSHELKTPLTAIRGAVETLLGGAFSDPAHSRPFLESIAEESERLDRLVEDLLALARVESKQAALRREPISMKQFLEEEVARHRVLAEAHGVSLQLESPQPTRTLRADCKELSQAVSNLLDNAIKYNRPGGQVTVRTSESNGQLRIEVQDTGIGIPAQDLPRIFERFYRVDKARSRETGGTGLGLAIVKHIAEAHGGSVQVESELGHGSRFILIFPLA